MIEILPTVNALLNATSGLLVFFARRYIRQGRIQPHKWTMISAVIVSIAFLISYLSYHAIHGSTRYGGTGIFRSLYLTILISHTILAVILVPLVLITLRRGLSRRDVLHKQIAKWTYPVWMYVSVTGVIVYVMLYRL